MKTLTKIGIVFLIIGFLVFLMLFSLLLLFAVGGGAGTQQPTAFGEIILFFIYLGDFWFVFVIVGVILIIAGALQKNPDDAG